MHCLPLLSAVACCCLLAVVAESKQLQCAESAQVTGQERSKAGVCATNGFCVNETATNAGHSTVVRRCERAGECKKRAGCGAFVKSDEGLKTQVNGQLCCCNDKDKCNNGAAAHWAPFVAIAVGLAAAVALRH